MKSCSFALLQISWAKHEDVLVIIALNYCGRYIAVNLVSQIRVFFYLSTQFCSCCVLKDCFPSRTVQPTFGRCSIPKYIHSSGSGRSWGIWEIKWSRQPLEVAVGATERRLAGRGDSSERREEKNGEDVILEYILSMGAAQKPCFHKNWKWP